MSAYLPEQFACFEKYAVAWCLPTEKERNRLRIGQKMEELKEFHDDLLEKLEDILAYLSKYSLDNLPPKERNLLYLALSFMEVAIPVEYYNNPTVPDAFDPGRFEILF